MNFTGGNTLPNIGKRINWQLVTLAGGLAIAVSAAAGLGAFERDAAPPAPAQPAASVSRAFDTTQQATMPRPITYIVESSEQEALVTAAIDADRIVAVMQGQEVPLQQTRFLVVSTPEEEWALSQTLMEQLELSEPGFDVVDLRGSSTAISAPDATSQSPVARPTLYVVDSAEQEAEVVAAMAADKIVALMEGNEVPFHQTSFLVVSTPEDEQALNETLKEQLLLTEPAFEIVDLRN